MSIKHRLLPLLALLLCLAFSYALAEESAVLPIDLTGGAVPNPEGYIGEWEYQDPTIHVVITTGRVDNCDYWMADVTIAHASQLRTMSAGGFDTNRVTRGPALAQRVNAVVAIDGDYYCYTGKGYIVRQGVEYLNILDGDRDLLLIDEDGDFHIIMAEDHPESMDKTVVDGKKVVNALCFGPALVKDGQKVLNLDHEQKNTHGLKRAQRICIAQLGPLEYLVVCCAHYGMNLSDFTDLVMSLGDVKQAYNLDGGNSTYMMFLGHKVNNTEAGSPRLLADIIYFASAYVEDGAAQ